MWNLIMHLVLHELVEKNSKKQWTIVESIVVEKLLDSEFFRHHCVLTFDDGNKSDVDIALPLLKKYGVKAIFFIVTDFIGKDGYITIDDIKTLHRSGMTIGSHSKSHNDLTLCSIEQVRHELEASKAYLEKLLKVKIDHFSIPYGEYDNKVLLEAKRVYDNVYTSCPSHLSKKLIGRLSLHRNSNYKISNRFSYYFVIGSSIVRYSSLRIIKRCIGYENYKKAKVLFYG